MVVFGGGCGWRPYRQRRRGGVLEETKATIKRRGERSRDVLSRVEAACAGRENAGDAREALEKRLKRPIVSRHNYLRENEAENN